MRATALFSSLFLLGLGACGDSAGNSDATAGEVGTGDSSGDGSDTGSNLPSNPVTGLTLTKVTANQGVAIPITQGPDWVGPENRNARLVGGRDTLIRTFWTLDAEWVPRDILCRLEVTLPDGTPRVFEQVIAGVSEDSNERFLDTTCYFGLTGEDGLAEGGTTFQVSLHEVDEQTYGLTEHPVTAPANGQELIGLEAGLMRMKIRLVPMTYQGNTPDVEGNLAAFRDYLFMNNPLNEIEIDVREPVETGSSSLNTMLTLMTGLHAQDEADANMYYFAVIDTGQQSGTVGLASLGSLWGSALWLNSFGSTRNTVVHEVGHCEGLGHVECPTQGMAPFEPYPYPDGKTGVTGFGIRDFTIHGGDINYQYMSYCGGTNTTWASDWDWNRNWNRIALFSSDEYPNSVYKQPVLHGVLGADGVEHWWTLMDEVKPETMSANHTVTFKQGDTEVTSPAGVEVLSDGASLWFTIPLPEGMDMHEAELSRSFLGDTFEVKIDEDKYWHELPITRGRN